MQLVLPAAEALRRAQVSEAETLASGDFMRLARRYNQWLRVDR